MDNPHSSTSTSFSEQSTEQRSSLNQLNSGQSHSSQSGLNQSDPTASVQASHSASSTALTKAPPRDLVAPWSESLQSVLDQPPAHFPKIVLMAGIVFTCAFLIWAWFSRLQDVSFAQGQLTSAGGNYKVQALVSGEVEEILVDEGDPVKKGQMLARLDSHIEEVEIERLEESIAAYQLQLLQTRSLIGQTLSEAQVQRAIAASELQAQEAMMLENQANAATTHSLLSQVQHEAAAHEERLARIRPLVEEGAIAEDALFEVEQSLRERQQSITSFEGEMEKNQAQLAQAQALLAERQAEGERIQLELKQRLQSLERDASELEAKIVEAEKLLKTAESRLEQMVFYAPNDGYVLDLSVQRVGEMVEPGNTFAEIAPAGEPLVLSAALPSSEAGLVEEGMDVQIKLDAFPYQDYGTISGVVSEISPDAEVNEQLGAVYRLEIDLDQNYVMHESRRTNLRPGQTAKAEIVIRRRRILDMILDPIRKLQRSEISL